MPHASAGYMDPRPSILQQYNAISEPWSPYSGNHQDPAPLIVQDVDRMFPMDLGRDINSNSSPGNSPRQCGADVAIPHGPTFQAFSQLNEPAFRQPIDTAGLYFSPARGEYLGTDTSIATTKPRSEHDNPRLHPSQNSRHHPYKRNTGRNYTVYSYTSPQSDYDAVSIVSPTDLETRSTHSQADNHFMVEQYHSTSSEYIFENINPQDLTAPNPQPAQGYPSSCSPIKVELSPSSHHTMVPQNYESNGQAWPYVHLPDVEDTRPDEENEEVAAQGMRNDLKKGGLKKSNSKKSTKRGAKGSIKGVQKSGEGKADKSVRGKKSKDRHTCAHSPCSQVFSNASELRKHMQVKHLRPFKCTFSFAGCDQVFGSKNEWKRHVNCQHMALAYWQCNLALCKDRQALFNRKDLCGQHMKRMHVPQGKKVETYFSEAQKRAILEQNQQQREHWIRVEIPKIQDSCFKVLREPPLESSCELCDAKFSGPKGWDSKLEHVGKHYENGDQPLPAGPFVDSWLIQWALEHELITERDPYESSSNASESGYPEPFDQLSPSVHKVLMENHCKYQFTKSNHFMMRSSCSDQSSIKNPSIPPLPEVEQADSYINYSQDMHDNLLFDGAFNDAPPGEHDTLLLFQRSEL